MTHDRAPPCGGKVKRQVATAVTPRLLEFCGGISICLQATAWALLALGSNPK